MWFKIRLLLLLLLLSGTVRLSAQSGIASPYSRYGLGDLQMNYNAWNFAMGQISYGVRSPYHINWNNPASLTAFDSATFVFEGGFNADFVELKSNISTANANTASLGYIQFGMPITRWWRSSLGLLPYSKVGYSVAVTQQVDGVGRVIHLYTGDGGVNQFMWGNGFRITRNFSIGLNMSYLFGNMDRRATVLFPDSAFYTNYKQDFTLTMHDFYFTSGVQYSAKLDDTHYLNAGAVFSTTSKMNAELDYLSRTFLLGSSGVEYIQDTIAYGTNYRGHIVIPWTAGAGISLGKNDRWMFGLDGRWQNWQNFSAFGQSDSLVNSYQVSGGAEVTPNPGNYSNYLKRIIYRAGFHYQGTYLKLRGRELNEYAFSLGFGLPLRGMKTTLNLAGQVGVRGTTQNGLIRETSFRFVVGFSIYDKWFVKKKYY
jgi:hypothetical protein